MTHFLPYTAGGVSGTYVKCAALAEFNVVTLETSLRMPEQRKRRKRVFAGAAIFTFVFSTTPR